MSAAEPAGCLAAAGESSSADAAQLSKRIELLRDENTALGVELLRCYEQLSLVFEITANIATLEDPGAMRTALLRRFGVMLGAGAVFVDHGGRCVAIDPADSLGRRVVLNAESVRGTLAQETELVRHAARARVPARNEQTQQALQGAHVMLVPLRQMDADAAVVVALRHCDEPPFDSRDMLAAESVLGYGGHILANVLMVRHLQQVAVGTVRALANAIDAKDEYTCGHSERVGWLARLTGSALGLSESELEVLEWAGILHDVGKIGVSDQTLKKPGRLTAAEYGEMKRHPRLSHEVLKPVQSLGPALDGVLHHHENWDGSGYPDGLSGEEIPLFGRIIRVVDTFDALTSTRSYRKGNTVQRAIGILEQEAGRSTDPHVTKVFIDTFERYVRHQNVDFRQRFAHIARRSDRAAAPAEAGQACAGAKPRKRGRARPAQMGDAVR